MKKIIYTLLLAAGVIFTFSACSKSDNSAAPGIGGSGTGGSLARFTIYGNYLYVVDGTSLKTFNISNPKNMVQVSVMEIGSGIETIYPYNGNLFIGSATAMYIYSLRNPEQPQQEGMASHVRACDPVVAKDNLAYVTVRSTTNGSPCGGNLDALIVYDISNIQYPTAITTVNMSNPHGLGIAENTLYVCDGQKGLKVFDVNNATNPRLIKSVGEYNYFDVIPYNDVLICMVEGGMVIFDITEKENPVFVAKTF
ncbi:MAG: hypothetical protein BGO31_05145 [Bacteroidetes bacterium 43-16]|nr:MAG: hypothetical protein BGO31_05145 [Bacteroidetes bacterium 43-16]